MKIDASDRHSARERLRRSGRGGRGREARGRVPSARARRSREHDRQQDSDRAFHVVPFCGPVGPSRSRHECKRQRGEKYHLQQRRDPEVPDTEYDQYYRPLRYALSELIENALTHARRQGAFDSSVWVAAQYYKDAQTGGRVQVAVVDNGCGFLATLQHHPELPEKTHGAAIRTALKPKVSCNRDIGPFGESVNEGVGLTTAVRISKATGGDVHIVSGDALFFECGGIAIKRSEQLRPLPSKWDGVAISATFICKKLPSVSIPDLLPVLEAAKLIKTPIALRFDD